MGLLERGEGRELECESIPFELGFCRDYYGGLVRKYLVKARIHTSLQHFLQSFLSSFYQIDVDSKAIDY